jgi:hypothetical protein
MSFSDLSDDAIYHIREFLGDTLHQVNTRMRKMFKCIEIHVSTTVTEVYLGSKPYTTTYDTEQVEKGLLMCGQTTIGEDSFSFEFKQTTIWHTVDDYDDVKDMFPWITHYKYECGDQHLTIFCNNKEIDSDDLYWGVKLEWDDDDKNELNRWAKENEDDDRHFVYDWFCDHLDLHLIKLDGDMRRYFGRWSFSSVN